MSDDHTEGADVDRWDAAALAELLAGVDGVASLEVDLREDGSPRLRLQLDGSISGAEVSKSIRRLLAQDQVADTPAQSSARKVGLGKDLSAILAADRATAIPTQLQPTITEPEPSPVLALVAVEETAGGISVRAADSGGAVAFSPVEDPRSLNQAVVSAVGRLRQQKPLPRLAGVEVRDVDGAPVLTVVLALADGRRGVGSALVEGGMPFTLGRAVWEALASSR